MRNHRLHRRQAGRARSSSTGCGGSNTAATTRPASPSSATARSSCGGAPASWRASRRSIAATPLDGDYGIGHTRWATHGRPTEENAHPHRDCTGRIVVVHNGIIENYLELKQQLQKQGHTFVTETDTEIVAHLVEREMKDDGLENAVRRALLLHARPVRAGADLGRRSRTRSSPCATARRSSSASATDEFFVASDIPAILSHTRDVVFLGDEEMAVITRARRRVHRLRGPRGLEDDARACSWDPVMAEKGGYKHFMLKEIFEQPRRCARPCSGARRSRRGKVFLAGDRHRRRGAARRSSASSILACGTSWHAALVGKFLIESLARRAGRGRLRLRVPLPRSDRRDEHAGDRDHAVGRDRRHARGAARGEEEGRAQHRHLQRRRQHGDARDATAPSTRTPGPEIGVASTKAFTTQLVALLPARDLPRRRSAARSRRTTSQAAHRGAARSCRCCSSRRSSCEPLIEEIARRFYQRSDFLFLGRGINYPIALEGALKLKEISYIHAEGYPAGEMKHGPIALIDEHMPVVAIAPRRSRVREDDRQHPGGQGARRLGHRADHRRRRRSIGELLDPAHDFLIERADVAPAADADADGRSRCSCSRTTSPSAAAATSISRGTSRRA